MNPLYDNISPFNQDKMPKRGRNDLPAGIHPGVKINKKISYSKLKNGALVVIERDESRDIRYIYPPTAGKKDELIFFNALPLNANFVEIMGEINSIIYILIFTVGKSFGVIYIDTENLQCGEIQMGGYKPVSIINYRGDFWFVDRDSGNSEYRLRKVNGIESVAHAEELIICDNLLYSDNLITITWIPESGYEHGNDSTCIKVIYQVESSRTREIIYRYTREYTVKTSELHRFYDGNVYKAVNHRIKLDDKEPYISGKNIFIDSVMITLPDEYCG